MSKKEKLIQRLRTFPKDFTYDEAKTLLIGLGYIEDTKGKTSGSRICFYNKEKTSLMIMHKPHPENCLKAYMIKQLVETLIENGDI